MESNNSPVERPKKTWLKFRPIIVLFAIVVFFYAEEDIRGKWAWNRLKEEWEAKGESFDRAKFIPPPVPDDQNFALTPIVFTSYGQLLTRDGKRIPQEKHDARFVNRLSIDTIFDLPDVQTPTNGAGEWQIARLCTLKEWQDYYRTLAAKTNFFSVSAQPQTPAQDILLALSKYDSTIKELEKASQLPRSRFPLDYDTENPAAILLPHLAHLKSCSMVLQLRAIAELQSGEADESINDVKLIFRLAESVRTEPVLITHLVRRAIVIIALQPVYEGLARHQWSDAQLVEIDAELVKLDFLADYKFAMRGEMVFLQQGVFDYLRNHPEELFNLARYEGSESSSPWTKILGRLIPSGWFYQNEAGCARIMLEYYIPMADLNQRTLSPPAAKAADAMTEMVNSHVTPYNVLQRILLPSLNKAAERFAHSQSCVDQAQIAIALERFRLTHKAYPDSLHALVPQFLQKLPNDVINGLPLHYQPTEDGQFILYSVGWNLQDENGVAALSSSGLYQDINKGDWVWRYPAKQPQK